MVKGRSIFEKHAEGVCGRLHLRVKSGMVANRFELVQHHDFGDGVIGLVALLRLYDSLEFMALHVLDASLFQRFGICVDDVSVDLFHSLIRLQKVDEVVDLDSSSLFSVLSRSWHLELTILVEFVHLSSHFVGLGSKLASSVRAVLENFINHVIEVFHSCISFFYRINYVKLFNLFPCNI